MVSPFDCFCLAGGVKVHTAENRRHVRSRSTFVSHIYYKNIYCNYNRSFILWPDEVCFQKNQKAGRWFVRKQQSSFLSVSVKTCSSVTGKRQTQRQTLKDLDTGLSTTFKHIIVSKWNLLSEIMYSVSFICSSTFKLHLMVCMLNSERLHSLFCLKVWIAIFAFYSYPLFLFH